jgi:hypothetical protein
LTAVEVLMVQGRWRQAWRALALASVVLLAILLRLPYLTERSIWFDEASSWRTASLPLVEMLRSIRQNVHAPLYYLLLKSWMAVFGDSVGALRSLSVAFGAATVVGMYLFGREVYLASGMDETAEDSGGEGGRERGAHRFALVLAVLVAVSPFQVLAAIEVKMYSLGTALVAFGSWFLLRALRLDRAATAWTGYAACAVAFLYTHHYALLSVAAQLAFLGGYLAWLAGRGQSARAFGLLRTLLLVGLVVALYYLPWSEAVGEQVRRVQASFWAQPLDAWSLPRVLGQFVVPIHSYFSQQELFGLTAATAGVLLVAAWRPRRAQGLVLAAAVGPLALAAAISYGTPIWHARYFRFAHLFFLTAVVLAIWRVTAGGTRAVLAGLVLANLAASDFAFWEQRDIPHKPGMRGVIERILAEDPGDTPIVVLASVHYFPARYYAPPGREVRLVQSKDGIRHYDGGPLVVPGDLISPDELAAHRHRGLWVISPSSVPHGLAGLEDCRLTTTFQVEYDYPAHSPIWVFRYAGPLAKQHFLAVEKG